MTNHERLWHALQKSTLQRSGNPLLEKLRSDVGGRLLLPAKDLRQFRVWQKVHGTFAEGERDTVWQIWQRKGTAWGYDSSDCAGAIVMSKFIRDSDADVQHFQVDDSAEHARELFARSLYMSNDLAFDDLPFVIEHVLCAEVHTILCIALSGDCNDFVAGRMKHLNGAASNRRAATPDQDYLAIRLRLQLGHIERHGVRLEQSTCSRGNTKAKHTPVSVRHVLWNLGHELDSGSAVLLEGSSLHACQDAVTRLEVEGGRVSKYL